METWKWKQQTLKSHTAQKRNVYPACACACVNVSTSAYTEAGTILKDTVQSYEGAILVHLVIYNVLRILSNASEKIKVTYVIRT